MTKDLLWEPDVRDWASLSVDSYQFIIDQGKERLEEVLTESNVIVSRSISLLLAYIPIFSAILGYIFSERNKSNSDFVTIMGLCLLSVFSVYIFTLLFALIASRRVWYKGSPPREIFRQHLFEGIPAEHWLKIIMLNEVRRIQNKIERIQSANVKSTGQFRAVLRVSLLFVFVFVFALFRRIFSGS